MNYFRKINEFSIIFFEIFPFLLPPFFRIFNTHNHSHSRVLLKSFNCDEVDTKSIHGMRKRSSFVFSIMSNPRSLSGSRNSSFCMRNNLNQNSHAKRIAQILMSPTGSFLPSNESSSYPIHESPTMVCDFQFHLF